MRFTSAGRLVEMQLYTEGTEETRRPQRKCSVVLCDQPCRQGININSFARCTACVLLFASNFTNRFVECVLTVLSDTKSLSAISWLESPCAISSSTSYSRLLMPSWSSFV